MMQDLDEAVKNTTDPILRIDFSVMAINHLIAHHNMFGCVDFRNRKIYDIPYRICPDQTEYFEIITEIDYKELLKKFIDHATQCEGVSYVDAIGCHLSTVEFAPMEIEALKQLESEILKGE